MTTLRVSNLTVRHGLLHAVRDVGLTVADGEVLALVGANGAGKTTLLRAIAGAHLPLSGSVFLGDVDVTNVPAHQRVGKGIALVPEGRRLFLQMTVEENASSAASPAVPARGTSTRYWPRFPIWSRASRPKPAPSPAASNRRPPSAAPS